MRAAGSARN